MLFGIFHESIAQVFNCFHNITSGGIQGVSGHVAFSEIEQLVYHAEESHGVIARHHQFAFGSRVACAVYDIFERGEY